MNALRLKNTWWIVLKRVIAGLRTFVYMYNISLWQKKYDGVKRICAFVFDGVGGAAFLGL